MVIFSLALTDYVLLVYPCQDKLSSVIFTFPSATNFDGRFSFNVAVLFGILRSTLY